MEIIRLAEGAQRLLNDEAATVAIKSLLEEIKNEWVHTAPQDKDGRERLWMMGQVIQLFVQKLQTLRDRGQFEIHKSEQARKAQASSVH